MSVSKGSTPKDQYRILITGSRNWGDARTINLALLDELNGRDPQGVTVVHGAARGADSLAARAAAEYCMNVEAYPADWDKHGKAAGPIRNQQMVDLGADVCLAFPHPDSRGTKHCMTVATRAGIPVRVFEESR